MTAPRRRTGMRVRGSLLAFVLALAGVWGHPASACDSASCSLLTRGANGLLPKKKVRFDLSFGYTDKALLLDGSHPVDSVYRPRIFFEHQAIVPGFHRDIDGYDRVLQGDLTYGLSPRLNLQASVPLVVWHTHEVAHGSYAQEYGTVGFGDVLLGARWSMRPRRLVAGFSVKLPTGRYDIGGEFGGGIQDPILQPGTGAFDFVGLLRYSWRAQGLGLDCTFAGSYQATTTNPLAYRFGNQAIATATAARPLTSAITASLQAKLYHQDRSLYLGQGVPSTGGTFVYITPGLNVRAARGFTMYAYLLLVPYRYVNEAQLGPRAAVLTGVSKMF
ncbi:MAG TPA: transporter [Vicinamibacteria bacterium]|nr:transporter [Vicinamibacteria bacterium]